MEIRNNKLTGNDLSELTTLYPSLYKLKLGQNQIKSIDQLKVLSKLTNLKKLEVAENEFTRRDKYRDEIFKALPTLESVDNRDKKGGDVETTFHDEDDEDFAEDEDAEFDDGDFDDDEDEDIEDDDGDDDEEDAKPTKKPKKA